LNYTRTCRLLRLRIVANTRPTHLERDSTLRQSQRSPGSHKRSDTDEEPGSARSIGSLGSLGAVSASVLDHRPTIADGHGQAEAQCQFGEQGINSENVHAAARVSCLRRLLCGTVMSCEYLLAAMRGEIILA